MSDDGGPNGTSEASEASRAVVVGGGLAGIAAALRLADGGMRVSLLERKPRLGGAAFSFRRGELSIDNGQHVFLRCCTAYQWLVNRISATDQVRLQDRLDIPVLRADGRTAHLRRSAHVPAPGHLSAALLRYRLLSPVDRLRAARGALALRRLNPDDISLDMHTLDAFLRQHGQNDATISALWGIVATATLNLRPEEASLALAAKVFRTGLLDTAKAADVGYAAVPLGELHGTVAGRALQAAGVDVVTGCRVDRVTAGTPAVVATDDERRWEADAVVVALPHAEAFEAVPALSQTVAAPARGLGSTPIVNVHVMYDRQVTDLPFAAAVDSPVQWFFDRTDTSGLRRTQPGGQYLAVTVSAADDVVDTPSGELTKTFVAELAELLPAARRAEVVDAFVTRERQATFRQAAGSASRRPPSDVGLEGVWIAGAWTATGWPDTMEGAVRSGVAAARAALHLSPAAGTTGSPGTTEDTESFAA